MLDLFDTTCLKTLRIPQFLAEKIAALDTENLILKRAKRGDRGKFLSALDSAPDVEPPDFDRLLDLDVY